MCDKSREEVRRMEYFPIVPRWYIFMVLNKKKGEMDHYINENLTEMLSNISGRKIILVPFNSTYCRFLYDTNCLGPAFTPNKLI